MPSLVPAPLRDATATRRGLMGVGAQTLAGVKSFLDAIKLAVKTTATLPEGGAELEGSMVYDSTTKRAKLHDGTAWLPVVVAVGGDEATTLEEHIASEEAHTASAITYDSTNVNAALDELYDKSESPTRGSPYLFKVIATAGSGLVPVTNSVITSPTASASTGVPVVGKTSVGSTSAMTILASIDVPAGTTITGLDIIFLNSGSANISLTMSAYLRTGSDLTTRTSIIPEGSVLNMPVDSAVQILSFNATVNSGYINRTRVTPTNKNARVEVILNTGSHYSGYNLDIYAVRLDCEQTIIAP